MMLEEGVGWGTVRRVFLFNPWSGRGLNLIVRIWAGAGALCPGSHSVSRKKAPPRGKRRASRPHAGAPRLSPAQRRVAHSRGSRACACVQDPSPSPPALGLAEASLLPGSVPLLCQPLELHPPRLLSAPNAPPSLLCPGGAVRSSPPGEEVLSD
ncbi:uncharacterized protein LOC144456998 [Phascolarctos cinereus]